MIRFVFLLAAAWVCSSLAAEATQQGQTALTNWKQMDNCAKQAQAAFPEFNAESNARRDAKLKECLSGSILPPRQPASQPPPR
jgi:hypothetical protein